MNYTELKELAIEVAIGYFPEKYKGELAENSAWILLNEFKEELVDREIPSSEEKDRVTPKMPIISNKRDMVLRTSTVKEKNSLEEKIKTIEEDLKKVNERVRQLELISTISVIVEDGVKNG